MTLSGSRHQKETPFKKPWKQRLRETCLDQIRRRMDRSPRAIVQQTLLHQQIGVQLPTTTATINDTPHVLTEDELYELLEELEDERLRCEQQQLEERLFEEHTALHQQLEDLEAWENHVVCPLCQVAPLWQQHEDGSIQCATYESGICGFHLHPGLTLASLQQQLQQATHDHEQDCYHTLSFHNDSGLTMTCPECSFHRVVL